MFQTLVSKSFSARIAPAVAAALCIAAGLAPQTAAAAVQSDAQQKCINAIYKSGAKVVDAVGKGLTSCLSNAARDRLPAGMTAQQCLSGDVGGGIAKATSSLLAAAGKSCTLAPTVGPDAAAVAATALSGNVLRISDTFGFPLDDVIIPSTDKAGAGCQSAVAGNIGKLVKAKLKEFNRCVSTGLKAGTIDSDATLGACMTSVDGGKVPKAVQKSKDVVALRCAGQTVADLFPGDCAAEPLAELASCVNDHVDCGLCLAMVAAGGLDADCDMIDDGIDDDSCKTGPDWPALVEDYTVGPVSYVSALDVPAVNAGVPTCCRDFGPISRDFIEHGTNHKDNALASLGDTLGLLGLDLQSLLDDTLTSGSVALLLDHQGLDTGIEPDQFALAALNGSFAGATDYADAAAGTGEFTIDSDSFLPGTGEPFSVFYPGSFEEGPDGMSAGPSTLRFPIPFGLAVLELPVADVRLTGDPTTSPGGISYANGKLSGYLKVDSFYEGINAILDGPGCACLGLSSSVYQKSIDGSWFGNCVFNPQAACTQPSEAICVTLSGLNPLSSPPQVCSILPNILENAADLDLNADDSVYEGFSVGFGFTGTTATVLGLTP